MSIRSKEAVARVWLAGGLYLLLVVLTAAMLGFSWKIALIAELLVVAWLLDRGDLGKKGVRVLAGLSAVRFSAAAPVALFAHPISAPLEDLTFGQMTTFATPKMLVAALQILWSMTPLGVLFATMFALFALPAFGSKGRNGWPAFAVVGGIIPLIAVFEPVTLVSARVFDQSKISEMVGVHALRFEPEDLSPRQFPTSLDATGSVSRVTLVMLESVGALNLLAHLARHPDGAMAKFVQQGLYYERVLSTSNASHMAQPAILTSQEYSRGVSSGMAHIPRVSPAHWGFASHFASKGWLTLMFSSQDETWLGMDAITKSKAFLEAKHASDAADLNNTYVDTCGTRKVFDSVTVREHDTRLAQEPGPAFTYLNLQNTHWPYIVEGDGESAHETVLDCKDQHVGSAWKLTLARRQYERALDESLGRLVDLLSRHPDTLFIITGDHGESMKPGADYGHAHGPSPDQMETFALFIGPGVASERISRSISGLDLLPTTIAMVSPEDAAMLPRDMLQGVDARRYGDADRLLFSVSYGLQPTAYAVDFADRWLRTSAEERSCENREGLRVDISECETHRQALAYWMSCKTSFYAQEGHERWFEPCWRLTRERFSSDVAQ